MADAALAGTVPPCRRGCGTGHSLKACLFFRFLDTPPPLCPARASLPPRPRPPRPRCYIPAPKGRHARVESGSELFAPSGQRGCRTVSRTPTQRPFLPLTKQVWACGTDNRGLTAKQAASHLGRTVLAPLTRPTRSTCVRRRRINGAPTTFCSGGRRGLSKTPASPGHHHHHAFPPPPAVVSYEPTSSRGTPSDAV